jgi:hypothetical protein
MKTLITIAVFGLFLPLGIAMPQYGEYRCLDWNSDQDAEISPFEMRDKLLSGVWSKVSVPTRGNQDYQLIVRFHPNGKASYMTQESDGTYRNNRISWSSQRLNNSHYLTLGDGDNQQEFLIETYCEGIELINVADGRVFSLQYGAPADKGTLLHRMSQLYGGWVNISHQVELEVPGQEKRSLTTARVVFKLLEDGTYSRQLWTGDASELIVEDRGLWNLSSDGKLIHFYPEGESFSHLAQVKWFELDELVLEQVLRFPDGTVVKGIRDLYFNKQ